MRLSHVVLYSAAICGFVVSASGQQLLPSALPPGSRQPDKPYKTSCSPYRLSADKSLDFEQRSCYFGERLISPRLALRAVFAAGYDEMRGTSPVSNDGVSELTRRVGAFYARHTAQQAGELLGGAIYGEDPRYHSSKQTTFWGRTRFALLSVVRTTDADGDSRPALAPIAGSFGSAFAGMAVYRHHNQLQDGFRMAGIEYSGYFTTALMHEFHPDLALLATRLLHRKKQD